MDNKISIIGVGRLGLCTALCLERAGYEVLAVDVSPAYVAQLNAKTFRSTEPRVEEFLRNSTNFRATTSLDEAIAFSKMIWILVDTPTAPGDRSYDHTKLGTVLMELNKRRLENAHIVVNCTVLPGYLMNVGKFLIKDCVNTTINYHPEFIAQGDIINGYLKPDMVLIGEGSKESGDLLQAINEKVVESKPKICRMSVPSAEITKISVNCFITMKISYANMIGDIADRTPGANKNTILQAVGSDSRIGTKYLRPGYGFGGPCFPRDNRALGTYARSVGIEPLMGTASDEYNRRHAEYQAEALLAQNLDSYVFEDVPYKEKCPVPIIEESQKLEVARKVARAGKKVIIRDREDIIHAVMKEFGSMFSYEIV